MIELEQFPAHIKSLTQEDWNRLFELLPQMQANQTFGTWNENKKQKDGSFTFPFIVPNHIVDAFLYILDELQLAPVFDWSAWEEGRKIINSKSKSYESLDLISLCKLFTLITRADRFNEGFLVSCFNDGSIQKIILAIKSKV